MTQTALPGNRDITGVKEWSQIQLQLGFDIRTLEETLAWVYQKDLTGLNIKTDDAGFFVILKAADHKGHYVHFTGGRSFADAVEAVLWEVSTKRCNWRPDKFVR